MVKLSLWRIATIVLVLVFALPLTTGIRRVFADGFTIENLPPATIGNTHASLFVRINPPVLVSGVNPDAYLQFRLFDANTNQTIQGTTFEITATKGVVNDAVPIMFETFATQNGLLTLHITPTPGQIQVFGDQDPFTPAWMADPGGDVKITGPLLLDGGLYHFHIKLVTINTLNNLFGDNAPTYDSFLSVGDVSKKDISLGGQTYNATLISYYDRASGFDLNVNSQTFSWVMPFDWNSSRINAAPSFLVHEEVRIPKSLLGFGNTTSFSATLNGQDLPSRLLLVDPYSYPTAVVVHYLLGKKDVVKYADQVTNKTVMQFTLSPSSAGENNNQTSGVWRAERSSVIVQWSPAQLSSGAGTTVHLQFVDTQGTGQQIAGDVHYDLTVFDSSGSQVLSRPGLVAKDGTDTQTLTFPADSTYRIEARITSINVPNFPADTRTDTARGIVVVPEFPAGAIIGTTGIMASIVLIQRIVSRSKSQSERAQD